MKRVMTTSTSVVAGLLLGAFGFSSVAAQEAAAEEAAMEEEEMMMAPMSVTLSGSLRYGAMRVDDDVVDDATWELGSGHGSRVRVTGSAELDGGLTAGYQLERGVGAASLSQRFHNVWLQGAFGTLTLGRQAAPYWDAQSFDGSYHLGGGPNDHGAAGRDKGDGIGFGTNLGGPFNVRVLVMDDNSSGVGDAYTLADAVEDLVDAGLLSESDVSSEDIEALTQQLVPGAGGGPAGDGADIWEVVGTLTAGPVTANVGFRENEDQDRAGIVLNGSVANISWIAGYERADMNQGCMKDMMPAMCDSDRFGAHMGFGLGAGTAYVQYEDRDVDAGDMNDSSEWLIGYSHALSDQVRVTAEHKVTESHGSVDKTTSAVVMRVDF